MACHEPSVNRTGISGSIMTAKHTGAFFGTPPTGKTVSLATIRIDRLRDRTIAEHWSVADMAGLLQQLKI